MHSTLQLIEQISVLPALGVRANQIRQHRGQNISLLMFGSETPGTHKMQSFSELCLCVLPGANTWDGGMMALYPLHMCKHGF